MKQTFPGGLLVDLFRETFNRTTWDWNNVRIIADYDTEQVTIVDDNDKELYRMDF
jgi:hypothetical protein